MKTSAAIFALLFGAGIVPAAAQGEAPSGPRVSSGVAVVAVAVDLRLHAAGLNLEIRRVYRPGGKAEGMLGTNWRLSLEKRIARENGSLQIEEADQAVAFTSTAGAGVFTGESGDRLLLELERGVRTRPDGVSETYGVDGRLTEIRRPGGSVFTLRYDSAGRLASVEGPGGSFLRFSSDSEGRLIRVDSSTGATAANRYTGGNLSEVQVNGGPVIRYAYDGQKRLIRIGDPLQGDREVAYDAQGRVVQRRFADGATERYEYDDAARMIRFTDPSGGVTSWRRSADGREEETTDPLGRRTVARLDDSGRLVTVTGATGLTARYSYDSLGRLASSSAPGVESHLEYLGDTPLVAAIAYSDGSRQTFDYDAQRNLTAIKDGAQTVGAFTYFPSGQLASLKEKGKPELRFVYYPDGRVKSETEVGGRSWEFEYDQRGNLVRQTAAPGRVTGLAYDAQDRLTAITDPAGATTRYAYDQNGRVARVTDPVGRVTRYEYDARGRLAARYDTGGRATRYRYDEAGRLASAVYPGGATYSYTYDRAGALIRATNPLGGATRYGYDGAGQLASITDPVGRTWKYEYSAPGQLGRAIAPGGRVTEFQYDAQRRRSGEVDPAGRTVRLERDSEGRVTGAQLPGGAVDTASYDSEGRVAAEGSSGGSSVKYEYDAAGRIERKRVSTGYEVSVDYDPAGLVARVSDNSGAALNYQYNPQGLISAVIDQAGLAARISYDLSGLPSEIVNPLGQARRMAYSPAGDLIQLTETNGDTAKFEYDASGNLAAVHHPGGGVTRFVRDALANPVEVTDPLGATTRFLYDAAGRLTGKIDADGGTTQYSYDEAGGLTEERLPDGKTVGYEFDRAGRLLTVTDGTFPVRYGYDSAARRTRIEYPAIRKSASYEYDAGGLLAKFIGPDGREVRYGYDQNQRVNSMTLADGRAIRFGYDTKGRLTSIEYPNGVKGAWEWDGSSRLLRVSYRDAAGVEIDGCRYTYDHAGRPVRAVTADGRATEYRYDAAGQLIEEAGPSGAIRYAYAPGGNRVRREAGGKTVAYRQNGADQVVQAGDETIAYDRRGNMVERRGPAGLTRYSWDGKNRLVRVRKADGGEVEFGYTAAGSRAWRKDRNGVTYFVTDGVNLLADIDENLSAAATYIHAPGIDQPVAMLRGGQAYFFHPTALGTISSITDSAGKVAATYRMDAFGNLTASTGTLPNRLLFTAREYEADLGLYYYRARYYDPGLGRFLSTDPDATTLTDPIEGNRYAYARNSPARYRDPLGTQTNGGPEDGIGGYLVHERPGLPFRSYPSYAAYLQQEYQLTPEMVQELREAHIEARRTTFEYEPQDTDAAISQGVEGNGLEGYPEGLKGKALVQALKDSWKPKPSQHEQLMKVLERQAEPPAPPRPPAGDSDGPPVPLWEQPAAAAPPEAIPVAPPPEAIPVAPPPAAPPVAPGTDGVEVIPVQPLRTAALEGSAGATGAFPKPAGASAPAELPVGELPVGRAWEPPSVGTGAATRAGGALVMADFYLCLREGHGLAECLKQTGISVAVGSAVYTGLMGLAAAGGAVVSVAVGGTAGAGATAVTAVAAPALGAAGVAYGGYQIYKRARALPPAPLPDDISGTFGAVTPPPDTGSGFESVSSSDTSASDADTPGNLWLNDVFQSEKAVAEAAAAMQAAYVPDQSPMPNRPQPSGALKVLGILNTFLGVVSRIQGMQAMTMPASSGMGFMQKVQQQMLKSGDPRSAQQAQSLGSVMNYYKQWQQTTQMSSRGPALGVPPTITDFKNYVFKQTQPVTGVTTSGIVDPHIGGSTGGKTGGTTGGNTGVKPVVPTSNAGPQLNQQGVGGCTPPQGTLVGLTAAQLRQYGCTPLTQPVR